ncbi:MAG: RNA-binding cell elongation regulator Jag/EloR [Syntrophorhabdales bacterium]|jgi:spoIIIJ-associated protein
MDFVEVEGKTYEEAVRKATMSLGAEEKDLDIEVTEVDTKGILGLLGGKKIRIVARLRPKEEPKEEETPVEFGKRFLTEVAGFYGISLRIETTLERDRMYFAIESSDEESLTGRDGEVLESLQHVLKLAMAKRYKENLKLLLDVNGYREQRKRTIIAMAKRLAEKVRKEGKPVRTKPLNPYERRIIHTLFKNNNRVATHSEGDGHTKKVVIAPVGPAHARHET